MYLPTTTNTSTSTFITHPLHHHHHHHDILPKTAPRSWVTSEAYSSPSIVLISGSGANRVVLDDFREAYYWLQHNTKPDAKIMSW
jgi:hypothetical protein